MSKKLVSSDKYMLPVVASSVHYLWWQEVQATCGGKHCILPVKNLCSNKRCFEAVIFYYVTKFEQILSPLSVEDIT